MCRYIYYIRHLDLWCVCVCVNCCRLIYRYIAYRDTYSLCVWFFCIYLAGTIKPSVLLSGVELSLKPGVIANSWVYKRPEISTPYFAPEQIGFEIIIFCKTDLQKYHLLWFRKKSSEPGTHQAILTWSLWHWVRTMRPSSNSSVWSLGILIPGMEYTIRAI